MLFAPFVCFNVDTLKAPTGYNWPQAGSAPAYPASGMVPQAYLNAAAGYYQQAYPTGLPVQYAHYAGNAYPGYEPPPPYSEKTYAPQMMSTPYGYSPAARPTYVIPNAFDAGARFDVNSPPSVPPPPPGVVPNAAQLAAAQGHNVAMGQKQSDFFSGGSGGGYTFW
ncbi:DAZ-associated protein-like protein [Leptotrombidium deliense]|uniref:DAZ-associated protein 2 n=1 Tax=Leptotrombidium deliense TaxID=299467 RepID=A0A443SKJ9_9ACAR|nr:DAZ-associated protein-like protein [Leptotrombidium deliense]